MSGDRGLFLTKKSQQLDVVEKSKNHEKCPSILRLKKTLKVKVSLRNIIVVKITNRHETKEQPLYFRPLIGFFLATRLTFDTRYLFIDLSD